MFKLNFWDSRVGICLVLFGCLCLVTPRALAQDKRTLTTGDCTTGGAQYAKIDQMLEQFAANEHVPGLIAGVVANGEVVHCRALGVANVETGAPVTVDTAFRIASMTKNVTAVATLALRDQGRLNLDDDVTRFVPELGSPGNQAAAKSVGAARAIRLRDLLGHLGGFVTDDPWGDRQLPLPDAEFGKLIERGVPRARAPGMAYEYSNYGYALLGRAIGKASGARYQEYIEQTIFAPLGMRGSGWDVARIEAARLAIGYRYEDGAWRREPALGDGAFASMGGMITTARDYPNYLNFLLNAWAPDASPTAADAILSRASRRELAQPVSFPRTRSVAASDPADCQGSVAYGLGLHVVADCRFELALTHSGGLPGYGSNVFLMPDYGAAVFLFTNRTYAPAALTVRRIAARLKDDGLIIKRSPGSSAALSAAATAIGTMYDKRDVNAVASALANNLLLDRAAAKRNRELRALADRLGACTKNPPRISNTHALAGRVSFQCERGTLEAEVLLAPTTTPQMQRLEFTAKD